MVAVFEHLHAVDEYVGHPHSILVRLLECRLVGDRGRIEDDDVREHAFAQEASPRETEVGGREARQPVHRLFERDDFLIAHVAAEQACEVAVRPRMR